MCACVKACRCLSICLSVYISIYLSICLSKCKTSQFAGIWIFSPQSWSSTWPSLGLTLTSLPVYHYKPGNKYDSIQLLADFKRNLESPPHIWVFYQGVRLGKRGDPLPLPGENAPEPVPCSPRGSLPLDHIQHICSKHRWGNLSSLRKAGFKQPFPHQPMLKGGNGAVQQGWEKQTSFFPSKLG